MWLSLHLLIGYESIISPNNRKSMIIFRKVPKNPYLTKRDQFKIDFVRQKYNIKLHVISDDKLLSWKYIESLL